MRESVLQLVVKNVERCTEGNVWGVKFLVYPVAFLIARKVNWETNLVVNHIILRNLQNPIDDEIRGETWQFGADRR